LNIKVSPHSEKKDVFTISLDGDPWRDVHLAIFSRYPKLPNEVESLETWIQKFHQLEYQCVKQYVLRRLSSQSYHSSQLRRLLSQRLVHPSTIQKILSDCQSWGYLDDQQWVKRFIQSHLKKWGMRTVKMKLQAKGISIEEIEEGGKEWTKGEELHVVKHLLETRYHSKDLTEYSIRQQVIASLLRKGFAFDCIKEAIQLVLETQNPG
jgi:regulatory protein